MKTEIIYVTSNDGDALYLNGQLYDTAQSLNIYDLLLLLKTRGIVEKASYHNYKIEPIKFEYPSELKELNLK